MGFQLFLHTFFTTRDDPAAGSNGFDAHLLLANGNTSGTPSTLSVVPLKISLGFTGYSPCLE